MTALGAIRRNGQCRSLPRRGERSNSALQSDSRVEVGAQRALF
jgi:hypothetical protein